MRIKDVKNNRLPEVGEWFYIRNTDDNVYMRVINLYDNDINATLLYSSKFKKQVGTISILSSKNEFTIVEPEDEIILVRKD